MPFRIATPKTTGCVLFLLAAFAPLAVQADESIGQIKSETGAVSVDRKTGNKVLAIGDHVFQSGHGAHGRQQLRSVSPSTTTA